MSQYEAYLIQVPFHNLKFLTLLMQRVKSIGSNFSSLLRCLRQMTSSDAVDFTEYFPKLRSFATGSSG